MIFDITRKVLLLKDSELCAQWGFNLARASGKGQVTAWATGIVIRRVVTSEKWTPDAKTVGGVFAALEPMIGFIIRDSGMERVPLKILRMKINNKHVTYYRYAAARS